MASEEIIINAFVPLISHKQCFIDKQSAENWRNKQTNKDELQVIQYSASSDKLPDLTHIHCVLPNDDVIDEYLT